MHEARSQAFPLANQANIREMRVTENVPIFDGAPEIDASAALAQFAFFKLRQFPDRYAHDRFSTRRQCLHAHPQIPGCIAQSALQGPFPYVLSTPELFIQGGCLTEILCFNDYISAVGLIQVINLRTGNIDVGAKLFFCRIGGDISGISCSISSDSSSLVRPVQEEALHERNERENTSEPSEERSVVSNSVIGRYWLYVFGGVLSAAAVYGVIFLMDRRRK